MSAIHLYFQVHQPYRLNEFTFFDIGSSSDYFNKTLNSQIISKVSDKCYLPTNRLLLDLIHKYGQSFKCSFSFSGVVLEQLQVIRPDVIESFQKLVATGCVEIFSETYHHSLASLYDVQELDSQVALHKSFINRLFGVNPHIFRNTELILHPDLLNFCDSKQYSAVLAEGTASLVGIFDDGKVLGVKDHNTRLLCRDFELSDEIAYRFSDKAHPLYPLTPKKFIQLVDAKSHEVINLFMDYETFGEHHWEDTGIFAFLEGFVVDVIERSNHKFEKVEDALLKEDVLEQVKVNSFSSWADTEKDLSAWMGNSMQKDALSLIYEIKGEIFKKGDEGLLGLWRNLQTSDHFYYMSTKNYTDGEVHSYFSPYRSPYDAYLYYTNVLKSIRNLIRSY